MEAKQRRAIKHLSLLWLTWSRERVKNHESKPSRMKRLVRTLMRLFLGQILACLRFWNFPCPSLAQQHNNFKANRAVYSLYTYTLSRNHFFTYCLSALLSSLLAAAGHIFFSISTGGRRDEASSIFSNKKGGRKRVITDTGLF